MTDVLTLVDQLPPSCSRVLGCMGDQIPPYHMTGCGLCVHLVTATAVGGLYAEEGNAGPEE
jgi:hypothetical protein